MVRFVFDLYSLLFLSVESFLDLADSNGRSSDFDMSLSCEGNQAQNLPIQQQYSRRFRSSSTSNNSHLGQGNLEND